MHALLLAAGRSRRFWPLTEKNLLPILGKPLLQHQLDRLQAAGIKHVTVVVGAHNIEQMRAALRDVTFVTQENLDLGMQGALLSAIPGHETEPLLVVSGNDVIEPSAYRALLSAAKEKGADGAILARKVHRYFPGGYLVTAGERITGIAEKPGEGNEPSDLVNIVAHIHNDPSSLLAELRQMSSDHDDGYERALTKLLQTKNYVAVPYEGTWQAVKYPWHLLPLLHLLLGEVAKPHRAKSVRVHPTAVVEGNVILEDGVTLYPHAAVIGPCYIGRGSTIGNGALVRGCSIGERCVVGFGSEVKGSVFVGDDWTHMTYVGDSVIGRNVSFGGGTVTGNFRLDEAEISSAVDGETIATGMNKLGTIIGDGCRLGIQVGTNPGIKIGGGSFIAGATFVAEDVPEKSFVSMKDGKMLRRENRIHIPSPENRDQFFPKGS